MSIIFNNRNYFDEDPIGSNDFGFSGNLKLF